MDEPKPALPDNIVSIASHTSHPGSFGEKTRQALASRRRRCGIAMAAVVPPLMWLGYMVMRSF